MLPVLLFLAINLTKKFSKREIPWKLVILFILITVSMASIHRMIFMNGLVIFACIAYLLLNSFSILEIYDKINIKLKIISTTLLVLSLYISSIYGLFFYSGSSEYTIEAGKRFFDSDFLPLTILNLGLSYAVQFGFILPLSAVGFFSLFKKFNKEYKLLLVIVALYSLIWTDLTYGSFVYLPFIVILVCLGFQFLFEIFKDYSFFGPQTYSYTFILILILQTIPEFVVVNKSTYAGFPESSNYSRDVEYVKAYDSGLYLSSIGESDTVLISHLVSDTRISIYSGSPYYVESEMVNNSEFFTYEFTDISIFVTGKVNYIFEIEDDNLVRSFRYDVLFNDKKWDDSGNRINLNYIYKGEDQYILVLLRDISFVLGDNGQWYESPFISSATNENYKFYDNGFHTLYNLAYNS
tara:strand:+ start:24726 stop:25952 length:1227 start_codon:yes stop_codon:yes gene_type:complete